MPTTNLKKQFAGKVAVVTGGTQGLGEAIARMFAARGAAGVVICGRNAKKGKAVAADIGKDGAKVRFVQADLAKVEDCRKVIAEADKAFGRVDALVNVAATTDRGTILDTAPELFDAHVRDQCPRAVLPDPGGGEGDAAREDRRHRRQHPVDVGPWRPALHHRLLDVEGGARRADQERRLLADAATASASTASTSAGWIRPASTTSRCATTPTTRTG